MINFTVGPVMSSKEILDIGSVQIPYFRTSEFSQTMIENEKYIKELLFAKKESRVLFITGSGTASMDACVQNMFDENDKILVINGGSFGQRFCDICDTYDLNFVEIKCNQGKTITKDQLYQYDDKGFTALLVNLDETSTGVLYDIKLISDFCKKNKLFLVVDSISSFLCDEFNMKESGANVVIIGSQKALAIAPGLSMICLDGTAIDRVNKSKNKSYYFNLKKYIVDGERGQTPFTPAVGILLQINNILRMIIEKGGANKEIEETKEKAAYFRNKIKDLPFEIVSDNLSNAVTPLTPIDKTKSAYKLFEILKDKYNIWVCPNGGATKNSIFRVGHIGEITKRQYDILINSIRDIIDKKLW